MKKIIKRCAVSIIILAIALLLSKDYILRVALTYYFHKNFQAICKIKRVSLWLDGVTITDFACANDVVDITFRSGNIMFRCDGFSKFYVAKLYLQDAVCTIKSLPALGAVTAMQPAGTPHANPLPVPLSIDLQNIKLAINDKRFGAADMQFTLRTSGDSQRIVLERFEIFDCNIRCADFEASHITLRRMKGYLYALRIPRLRLKQREFGNLVFPLKMEMSRVVFPVAKNVIFGSSAYTSGEINMQDPGSFCLEAVFRHISLENIAAVIGGDENVGISGSFDGALKLCADGNNLKQLEGSFSNHMGGVVQIKKETALDFLRSYLDRASFDALVDNLKNYEYNKATIGINQQRGVIGLEIHFTSERLGERNITINFHNSTGGSQ